MCAGVIVAPETVSTSVSVHQDFDVTNSASGTATTTHMGRTPMKVQVVIGGAEGRLRYVGYSDGEWRQLTDIVLGEDLITARYRRNPINKPTLWIDRQTGEIRVSGLGFTVTGTCELAPEDPAARRF